MLETFTRVFSKLGRPNQAKMQKIKLVAKNVKPTSKKYLLVFVRCLITLPPNLKIRQSSYNDMLKHQKIPYLHHYYKSNMPIRKARPKKVLILTQVTQTRMIFLDTTEHFFHIGLGKVDKNWTSMRAIVGIFTLGKLYQQVTRRVIIQNMIGLD